MIVEVQPTPLEQDHALHLCNLFNPQIARVQRLCELIEEDRLLGVNPAFHEAILETLMVEHWFWPEC